MALSTHQSQSPVKKKTPIISPYTLLEYIFHLFLFIADVKDVGMVAGAVVGISLAVLIVIIIIWLVFRKKEKKKYEEEETPNEIRFVQILGSRLFLTSISEKQWFIVKLIVKMSRK